MQKQTWVLVSVSPLVEAPPTPLGDYAKTCIAMSTKAVSAPVKSFFFWLVCCHLKFHLLDLHHEWTTEKQLLVQKLKH